MGYKRSSRAVFCIAVAFLFLTGCEESYDDKIKELTSFVESNRIGGNDHFLEKRGDFIRDEWYPVSLVFGFANDSVVCNDLKQYLERSYPTEQYRCVTGN